jgi:hypothetical protein
MTAYVITGSYPAYTVTADGKHLTHATEMRAIMRLFTNRIEPGDSITWEAEQEAQ